MVKQLTRKDVQLIWPKKSLQNSPTEVTKKFAISNAELLLLGQADQSCLSRHSQARSLHLFGPYPRGEPASHLSQSVTNRDLRKYRSSYQRVLFLPLCARGSCRDRHNRLYWCIGNTAKGASAFPRCDKQALNGKIWRILLIRIGFKN